MVARRRDMIDELARAASGPNAVSPAILSDFDSARREFAKLSDDELQARVDVLRQLDEEGTDCEIVFIGEQSHFDMQG